MLLKLLKRGRVVLSEMERRRIHVVEGLSGFLSSWMSRGTRLMSQATPIPRMVSDKR